MTNAEKFGSGCALVFVLFILLAVIVGIFNNHEPTPEERKEAADWELHKFQEQLKHAESDDEILKRVHRRLYGN
jgi:hypothetical protein